MARNHKNNRESGAALVELAMSIPLLVLLVSAIVEFGNIFFYMTWIYQTGFNLAVVGGGVPQDGADLQILARKQQIVAARGIEEPQTRLDLGDPQPAQGSSYFNNDPSIRTVSLSLSTIIHPLGREVASFPIDLSITGPYLLSTESVSGSLSEFANPSPMFDCGFNQGSGSSTTCRPGCTRTFAIGSETCG